jgi:hypothetical protein
MAYRMTPARRAALKKAQIASARKRRKGLRGKASTFKATTRPKRRANKTLRKSAVSNARRNNKASRLARKAQRTNLRSKALASKSQRLAGKSKKFRAKQIRVENGTQATFGKRLKGAPARFKKRRRIAIAHAKRFS